MARNRIELFKKVMAMEEVEEVPAIPTVSRWVGRFSGFSIKELFYNTEAMIKAQLKAQEAIGYDALFCYYDAFYIPQAFGCRLIFLSTGADVSPLEINNEEDIKSLPMPDIIKEGRLPLILDFAKGLVGLPDRRVPVLGLFEGPFTTSARIMGVEKMMRYLIKNRSMVERMLDRIETFLSGFGKVLFEIGIDGLIIADPVGSSTMVSPKFYKEFVLPFLKRLIGKLSGPVILHVCGDTQPILPLMVETGARFLSLDQCMDLRLARQIIGDRCGIGGNVDPIILLNGTPEDVRQETLRCLEMGGKKGYLLMAGCAVPAETPFENLKAMIDVAKRKR